MVTFSRNGESVSLAMDSDTPLLWVLREQLELTGTKFGCGVAQCGACTVLVDGHAARACVTRLGFVAGKTVTTIEGLGEPDNLHPLQKAWIKHNVPQCGYCQSGQLMAAASLLNNEQSVPDSETIDQAMAGNLCRCGTYPRIRNAIKDAAGEIFESE